VRVWQWVVDGRTAARQDGSGWETVGHGSIQTGRDWETLIPH